VGITPTARTLAECRKRGWQADVVERRLTRTIKRDLFGCIDIVAITPEGMLGIQATSGSNHSARLVKAKQEPRLQAWLGVGARFEVWSWAKKGKRGKRKRWMLRTEEVVPVEVRR
jgi:hypothetical protein